MSERSFLEQLDAANDEAEVRERLAAGKYNSMAAGLAREWLRRKEEARAAEATSRAEAREEESLAISRKALENSRLATRLAASAIVLSIAMAILKIVEWYSK